MYIHCIFNDNKKNKTKKTHSLQKDCSLGACSGIMVHSVYTFFTYFPIHNTVFTDFPIHNAVLEICKVSLPTM